MATAIVLIVEAAVVVMALVSISRVFLIQYGLLFWKEDQERFGFEITENPTYNTCGNSQATGIYYLLREGPVLLYNHAPNRFSGVSNGKTKNDENNRTERPPLSKNNNAESEFPDD